jgi:hypothetical protein
VWSAIGDSKFRTDEQRLTVAINSVVHEFADRVEFASFCSYFDDYLDVSGSGSRRAPTVIQANIG